MSASSILKTIQERQSIFVKRKAEFEISILKNFDETIEAPFDNLQLLYYKAMFEYLDRNTNECKTDLNSVHSQLEQCNLDLQNKIVEKTDSKLNNPDLSANLETCNLQLISVNQKLEELQKSYRDISKDYDSSRSQVTKLKKSSSKKESDLTDKVKSLEEQLESQTQELKTLNQTNFERSKEKISIDNQLKELQKENKALKENLVYRESAEKIYKKEAEGRDNNNTQNKQDQTVVGALRKETLLQTQQISGLNKLVKERETYILAQSFVTNGLLIANQILRDSKENQDTLALTEESINYWKELAIVMCLINYRRDLITKSSLTKFTIEINNAHSVDVLKYERSELDALADSVYGETIPIIWNKILTGGFNASLNDTIVAQNLISSRTLKSTKDKYATNNEESVVLESALETTLKNYNQLLQSVLDSRSGFIEIEEVV